jgi:hypothetical protein
MCSWEGRCDWGHPLERVGTSRERLTSGNQALEGIGGGRGSEGLTGTGGLGRDVGTGDGEGQGGVSTAMSGGVGAGSCARRPSNFAL